MGAGIVTRDCKALHAEVSDRCDERCWGRQWLSGMWNSTQMSGQQLRGSSFALTEATLDDEAVESVLAASTSGRVDFTFWNERRKRRRRAWSSPTGVLYVVNRPNDFLYCELEQGRKLEENVSIDMKHSVSTCFEQGRLGEDKSILMSTSHKLDACNMLTTHYVNNLKGGEEFSCNSSHSIRPASRLSTCFHSASIGDPTLEVELEHESETKKISETFLANLRTGERLLRLQSKNVINDSVAFSNTYITNLRGQHSVRLEAALPVWGFANISKSFTTDFQQSHQFCLKAQQRIGEQNTIRTAFIRNLHHNNQISVELKHVAQGRRDVAVNLTSDLHGSTQFKVTSSHIRQANCWGWTFRKVFGEAHLIGVEWKREVAPDKFLLLRTSTQDRVCTVYAELRRPF
ncbi:hypothetical protein M758_2G004000 [Ceratodon purpureus]|uniref:Uncharacterized protein n=1 Tax=Ceratodon purpureus TaxID=3225 RepID=A0A8T0INL2_CERPU|nr:hypothetical protein KC19_2G004000 [Ceratodon purpureus]KAG0624789.1 hypothetical protein M758_2G004000 [Ceratodon purpureus]